MIAEAGAALIRSINHLFRSARPAAAVAASADPCKSKYLHRNTDTISIIKSTATTTTARMITMTTTTKPKIEKKDGKKKGKEMIQRPNSSFHLFPMISFYSFFSLHFLFFPAISTFFEHFISIL